MSNSTVYPSSSLSTIVQDEGSDLQTRQNINFYGAGVTATDDAANNQTDVYIPGVSGSIVGTRRTVVPPYTVASDDYSIQVNGSGTVTLPVQSNGRELRFKRINASGDVTISPQSGTIDGAASFQLLGQYQSVDLVSDGSNWFVL